MQQPRVGRAPEGQHPALGKALQDMVLAQFSALHCGRMPKGKKLSVNSVACTQEEKIVRLHTRKAAAQDWNLSLFHISHVAAPLNILKHCSSEGEVHTQG